VPKVSALDVADIWLFAYGTLQLRRVQHAVFGRDLDGRADVLPGYTVSPLLITDPDVIAASGTAHHTVVHETGDQCDVVPGTLYRITQAELAAADAYEVDCKRATVRLGSGTDAFIYMNACQGLSKPDASKTGRYGRQRGLAKREHTFSSSAAAGNAATVIQGQLFTVESTTRRQSRQRQQPSSRQLDGLAKPCAYAGRRVTRARLVRLSGARR
jgi:hypothetical protein